MAETMTMKTTKTTTSLIGTTTAGTNTSTAVTGFNQVVDLAKQWAKLGVLLNVEASERTPDLEHLLLDTARTCHQNPRLFILAVTWLARFGSCVAAHRLKQLALSQLSVEDQAKLGLLIETAVEHGAPATLKKTVVQSLRAAEVPRPLFDVDQGPLAALVEKSATAASKRWGKWLQPVELKPEALRTLHWVLTHNPGLRLRAVRKGDLRCSIIEVVKHDLGGGPVSESQLARACAASVPAIRSAVADLLIELPELVVDRQRGRGGSRISMKRKSA
jgi:hypothetical protein